MSDIAEITKVEAPVEPAVVENPNNDDGSSKNEALCTKILMVLGCIFAIITFPFTFMWSIKIVKEYEKLIVFRLGRLRKNPRGPGIVFIIPFVDTPRKVDLRTVTLDVNPQECLTKDSVSVSVDAIIYYRVVDPLLSVLKVSFPAYAIQLLTSTTIRHLIGTKTLLELLQERKGLCELVKTQVDATTYPWGIVIENVEIKNVNLPRTLQRVMTAEFEATHEANAKLIAAEGERKSTAVLKLAAETIEQSPVALQLRYLQTMSSIASEKNAVVFPLPAEIFQNTPNTPVNRSG